MRLIIVISGFTQHMHQYTGSRRLWRGIRERVALHDDKNVVIELKEWNSDWKSYAKYINSYNPTEVIICAYSWGGGYGMPQLAKRLQCPVRAVLCDPVFRSKTFLARWVAFLDWSIKIPKNVKIVEWFYQLKNEPGGDKLKGESIPDGKELDYEHNEMDDSEEYHTAAYIAVRKYLDEVK